MNALLSSMVMFLGAVCAHVILYRIRRSILATGAAYGAGLAALVFIVRESDYPLSAVFLYCLLVLGYLLYFLSYISEGQSPSAKVLDVVGTHGPISRAGIVSRFTNEELIGMRMRRLTQAGWIAKKGRTMIATRRGTLIAWLFARYRGLLKWSDGG